ncbi:FERM, ARHGEF and pleckstrin domain-containing protein 1-like isoform X1 [Salarias fasciatus]|uniref:FERM, ARHGEF and pleckstrin domain-containing protein 1-like isoform X1 n=1 Tax=Salarias fasciatus TaxID=181472 RepID=UPI001176863C|nr:FERM, ARHGEF and pleckstrin domain-containing protein 1-like isoform X1 [Salarias fasciatus]
MLDDSVESFQLAHRAPGKVLFDLVCVHLNLTEGDYFGLEYQDHRKMTVWLDLLKPALKQIRRPKNTILRFVVKFFPPDHTQLTEELTRYLFALQVKRDLACGRLICNDSSAALMVSHIIQSETGDLDEAGSFQHLLHHKYHPDQEQLREQIQECQRDRVGQTPAESDYQLLEVARRLDLYGVRLHPATDREGTQLSLAVEHSGVLVLQGSTRINSFNWSKIRKLSFKRKRFLIKLRSDPVNPHHDTLEFSMATRDSCKNFWKICVEHHAFFRLLEEPKPRPRTILFSRGSSFRFSGRTQKQVIDHVKDSDLKRVPFQRKHSKVLSHSGTPQTFCRTQQPAQVRTLSPTEQEQYQVSDQPDATPSVQPSVNGTADAPALAPPTNGFHHPDPDPDPAPQQNLLNPGPTEAPPPPSPLTSPLLTEAGYIRNEDEEEARRKKFPTNKAYFIAKELLSTERTFIKDLEVVTKSFPVAVATDESFPDSVKTLLSSHYDPVLEFHRGFLREMEQRLALWEGRSNAHIIGEHQRIGDVLLKNIQGLKQQLTVHLQKHPECLVELERCCRSSRRAEALCRELEQQRVCYLNLNTFLLRPLHRLLHYRLLLERLCKHYAPTHQDFRDCRAALADVSELVQQLQGSMVKMENLQKLLELQRELSGADNLVAPGREFIRLGCLSKLSGKGLQQRMFFLFSDVLLYTSRGMTSSNQFKVHGQLPLFGMSVRESEEEWGVPHCFTLIGQKQTVVAAASCAEELDLWLDDLRMAVDLAEQGSVSELTPPPADRSKPSEEEPEEELSTSRSGHRSNSSSSTVQVCWHRSTGLSMVDCSLAVENQLSGNLLRKFKNSSGWQKLWVVFTNFSLFFYKTHQDDAPLASLPLLGYSVSIPSEAENINKDYVFKLQFKAHVYYFRSESEYAFLRWMEVIRSATCSSSRSPSVSRKDVY